MKIITSLSEKEQKRPQKPNYRHTLGRIIITKMGYTIKGWDMIIFPLKNFVYCTVAF